MKYFHATAPETSELEDKLTEMESAVDAYERGLSQLAIWAHGSMGGRHMDKARIAILASGSGSNAQALMVHFASESGAEVAEVVWVCTNRREAGVRERAILWPM